MNILRSWCTSFLLPTYLFKEEESQQFKPSEKPATNSKSPERKFRTLSSLDKSELMTALTKEDYESFRSSFALIMKIDEVYQAIYKELIDSKTGIERKKELIWLCHKFTLDHRLLPEEFKTTQIGTMLHKIKGYVDSESLKAQLSSDDYASIKKQMDLTAFKYIANKNDLTKSSITKKSEETSQNYNIREILYTHPRIIRILGQGIMVRQKQLFNELPAVAFHSNSSRAKYLKDISEFSNRLKRLFIQLITQQMDQKKCLKMIELTHRVRDYLLEHRDFQSTIYVHNALDDPAVVKLKRAFRYQNLIAEIKHRECGRLFAEDNNFKNLKNKFKKLEEDGKSFIPFLEIYSKDTTFLKEVNAILSEKEVVDVQTLSKLGDSIEKIFSPIKGFETENIQTDLTQILESPELGDDAEKRFYERVKTRLESKMKGRPSIDKDVLAKRRRTVDVNGRENLWPLSTRNDGS